MANDDDGEQSRDLVAEEHPRLTVDATPVANVGESERLAENPPVTPVVTPVVTPTEADDKKPAAAPPDTLEQAVKDDARRSKQEWHARREQQSQQRELAPELWAQIQQVYESPFAPEPDPAAFDEKRVAVVVGPPHAGRRMSAFHLGHTILRTRHPGVRTVRLRWYDPPQDSVRTLAGLYDAARSTQDRFRKKGDADDDADDAPPPDEATVWVIFDPFGPRTRPTDLDQIGLTDLNRKLVEHRSLLLVTSTVRLDDPNCPLPHFVVRHTPAQLKQVWEKHLEWYSEPAAEHPLSPELSKALTGRDGLLVEEHGTAAHVNAVFKQFADEYRNGGVPTADELGEVIAEVCRRVTPAEARGWLRDDDPKKGADDPNALLLALLVYLFGQQPRDWVEDTYAAAVVRLRADGLEYVHPLARGMDELHERAKVQAHDLRRLEFTDPAYRDEVQRRLGEHYLLAWRVVAEVVAAGVTADRRIDPDGLAWAVAVLGERTPTQLERELDHLGGQAEEALAALPARVFEHLTARNSTALPDLFTVVERWARSGDPNRTWAAALTLNRVAAVPGGRAAVDSAQADRWVKAFDRLAAEHGRFRLNDVVAAFPVSPPLRSLRDVGRLSPAVRRDLDVWVARQQEVWSRDNLHALGRGVFVLFDTDPPAAVRLLAGLLAGTPPGGAAEPDAESAAARNAVGREIVRRLLQRHNSKGSPDPAREGQVLGLLAAVIEDADPSCTRGFLHLLHVWLTAGRFEAEVAGGLLRAANRLTPRGRSELIALLVQTWGAANVAAAVRRVFEAVIGRVRLLAGQPNDVPGASAGVVLVDRSSEARRNDTSARMAREVYHLMAAHCDLKVWNLGSQPAHPQAVGLLAEVLEDARVRPRLVMPLLEKANPDATPFVLLLRWGAVIDLGDVDGTAWAGRVVERPSSELLLPESAGGVNPVRALEEDDVKSFAAYHAWDRHRRGQELQMLFRGVNQKVLAPVFAAVEGELFGRLEVTLRGRTAEGWVKALAPFGAPAAADWAAVVNWLKGLAGRLDEDPTRWPRPAGRTDVCDPVRLVCGGVLWLASLPDGVGEAVKLLREWMADPRPEVVPAADVEREKAATDARRAVGGSAAVLLLRVHVPPADAAEGRLLDGRRFAPLLALGPPLAARPTPKDGLLVLQLARAHVARPDWEVYLRPGAESQRPALEEMMRLVPDDERESYFKALQKWQLPVNVRDEETAPALAVSLADRLRRAARPEKVVPSLEAGQKYGLLVVRPAAASEYTTELVRQVWRAMSERFDDLVPVGLMCGRAEAVAVAGDPPEAFDQTDPLPPFPGLLAPLLEGFDPKTVRFVVLIADGQFIDAGDWADEWGAVGLVCPGEHLRGPPAGVPWQTFPSEPDSTRAADAVVRSLAPDH